MIRKLLAGVVLLLALLASALWVAGHVITRDIDRGETVLGENETWLDDWYTITRIDEQTFAIGEPRYWQRNYHYLLLGEQRALLFDTGPGVRNIKPVVKSLTGLPLTVVSSHPHYDHTGNNHLFEHVAWLDIPSLRKEVVDDYFVPGFLRGFTTRSIPPFKVTEWWQENQQVDLGDRQLRIIHVPGHEDGSIVLYEAERKLLFTGDFIYPGWLVGFAPTSDIDAYLASTRRLNSFLPGDARLLGAHSDPDHPSPVLPAAALKDLEHALLGITEGSLRPLSTFPLRIYPVNDDMEIYLPPY